MAKVSSFACAYCDVRYTSKGNLNKHLQNTHKLDRKRKYDCDECGEVFFTLNLLKSHYEEAHNYRPVYEERRFRTMAAFKMWKQKMESDTGSRFVAQSAAKKSPLSRGKVLYLTCCRSGRFMSHGLGMRKLKSQGSVKCGRRCFASMTVVEKETGVSVVFQSTHRGHELDLRHVLLSDKERTAIAARLHKGVSLDAVLDSVREQFEGTLQRVHLLARQDLNVLVDSRPDSGRTVAEGEAATGKEEEEEEEDECAGVLSWVERMACEEDNPVLYFKQRGQSDCAEVLDRQPEDLLADDDFLLVLMTHPQMELLRKLGGRHICVDWTRGASGLELLTVVCLDGTEGAFPVAYCVTGQVDRCSALTFFRCVRAAFGEPVQAEALVSDDAPVVVAAWQEVMGPAEHCFLCAWGVDQAWRESIKHRIHRKRLQAFAYKALRTVMDAPTEKRLGELQEAFLAWCSQEGSKRRVLTDFMEHFRQNYAQRAEVWASCYRRAAGLGSSVRLEALHKVLEHCCLRGERVDRLVPLLLRLTRNKVIERLAKGNPDAEADFRAATKARHGAGLKIPRENVSCAGIGQWTVRTAADDGRGHLVVCQGEPCREACAFACPACQVCAHNTACSCPDSELRRHICAHIHAVFARTAEAMDVVEEGLRVCKVEPTDEQPAEDVGGGYQPENPSSEVPPTSCSLPSVGGDDENPTMCALLLHAIRQQLQHPCVEKEATPWLQPLLAAILERLNARAAAHRVALSYVVNNGVLSSTDREALAGIPPSKAQTSDGDVARAVLSIGQPAAPADRPAAPAVLVRTVEPPLSTNHRPILPAMRKAAETGGSARPTVPARAATLSATDPASQTVLIAELPDQEVTHTVPAGSAKPAGSAGHAATQTIFVKVAGPPPVLASQQAVLPTHVKMPALTASANHETTRTVFVPAAPLAARNLPARTTEPPVSAAVCSVPARMAEPAGSLDQRATQMRPPPSSTNTAAPCPVLARMPEPAVAAVHDAAGTAPARMAQPVGAQTIFVMGAPPEAKGDEVVCLVPLEMAEALAARRKAAGHSLPAGVAEPPVSAAQALFARMAGPAVSANHEAVQTVPARVPKPALSGAHEDARTVFVLAEPQAPTSREARLATPAEAPALSASHEDTRTVFVLAEPRASASHEARHTAPARMPPSAVPVDRESARGVFASSQPQVSTSHGSRRSIPAGIPPLDPGDTRTMFVLAEPQVSTSHGTRNGVAATNPAVSVDREDTRTIFVLAQPPVSSGHKATHTVPAGILKPASSSREDARTVFVLAEPEVPNSHGTRFTIPARIPTSALSLDHEAGFVLAEPQVSSLNTAPSVPKRVAKPAASVGHEAAGTVFMLAQPPVSSSHEHGVPAKRPKLAGPLDCDDTCTVFVLAQPQMSANYEAVPAKTAGPALPLDGEGSHILLVPVAEPSTWANHGTSRSVQASVAEPQLSPSHEAAHTILAMAAAPAKPGGRQTIRSILKASHETVHSAVTRSAEHAVPSSQAPRAAGFSFARAAEQPASGRVPARVAGSQLSPNHEAAHPILKIADPATVSDRDATLSVLVETVGSPLPADRGATSGAFAATTEPASPVNPEADQPDLAEGVMTATSTSVSAGTAGPQVPASHKGACDVLATVGEPGLSPNRAAADTVQAMADTAGTSADHEATTVPNTAASPALETRETMPTVFIKVKEPDVPSTPEATDGTFTIAGGPEGLVIIVRTAEPSVSGSDEGPDSVSDTIVVQAASEEEDDAVAASTALCYQAASDHDYCSHPQLPAGFTAAFPWTTSLVQHFPSSR